MIKMLYRHTCVSQMTLFEGTSDNVGKFGIRLDDIMRVCPTYLTQTPQSPQNQFQLRQCLESRLSPLYLLPSLAIVPHSPPPLPSKAALRGK